MRVRSLLLLLVCAVCCFLPLNERLTASLTELAMRATHNGYTVAQATGVRSVRVTGERLAGDCSAAMHVAQVSECCSPVSVEFKSPDCGGEPLDVTEEKGVTTLAYAGGKRVEIRAKKGHIHINYHKSARLARRQSSQSQSVSGPAAVTVSPVTSPAPPPIEAEAAPAPEPK